MPNAYVKFILCQTKDNLLIKITLPGRAARQHRRTACGPGLPSGPGWLTWPETGSRVEAAHAATASGLRVSVRRWLLCHGLPQCREGRLICTWRPA